MTKRLQVLMDDDELKAIQRLARKKRITTAEWARRRLRLGSAATVDTATKLAATHTAYRLSAPVPDIFDDIPGIHRRS